MAGYQGYSMSNNAVQAYKQGEKPRSKWTKAEVVAICGNFGDTRADSDHYGQVSTARCTNA